MAPLKREPHRAKRATAQPAVQAWWVKDFRIFVPVNKREGNNDDVVEERLPVPLRNALQQYAQELARKVRANSAKKSATEQVGIKRAPRRRGRAHGAPGLMELILAPRCPAK